MLALNKYYDYVDRESSKMHVKYQGRFFYRTFTKRAGRFTL